MGSSQHVDRLSEFAFSHNGVVVVLIRANQVRQHLGVPET
jgi:hypothetical protein